MERTPSVSPHSTVAAGSTPAAGGDPGDTDTPKRKGWIDYALDQGVYFALAGLIVYFTIASPFFFTFQNLANISQAVAITGIMAAGVTIALIAGQLDLTIGSMLALSSVITALALQDLGLSLPVAVASGLTVGLIVGALNGFLVVNVGINSIILTLAMALAIRGVALVVTDGEQVLLTDSALSQIVNARPFGIPVPFILMVIVYAAAIIMMSFTRFGYHVYAVGGNESAAQRAGIRVKGLYRVVFLISAVLAALAGILVVGRTGSGNPTFGVGAEFDVLVAVLLGGIGVSGGGGKVQRTLAGVIFVGVLFNGLTLLNVQAYTQQLVMGVVFVLAVVMAATAEKRKRR